MYNHIRVLHIVCFAALAAALAALAALAAAFWLLPSGCCLADVWLPADCSGFCLLAAVWLMSGSPMAPLAAGWLCGCSGEGTALHCSWCPTLLWLIITVGIAGGPHTTDWNAAASSPHLGSSGHRPVRAAQAWALNHTLTHSLTHSVTHSIKHIFSSSAIPSPKQSANQSFVICETRWNYLSLFYTM